MKKRIKNVLKKISNFVAKYLDDILIIIGAWLICYGISKIYIPAGIISTGIACISYAFLFAKNKSSQRSKGGE